MKGVPCPPRATVYCHECGRNERVTNIRAQRKPMSKKWPPPDDLRHVRGFMACGHGFNVAVTLATMAVMREYITDRRRA